MTPAPGAVHVDADFAEDVLAELYRYPRKRRWLAYALWLTLGWFGGHRFYLDRPGTALLMMFTGGGFLVWWLVDAFYVGSFVTNFNADQGLRKQTGRPPRELDFMPPLERDVLARPPAWTVRWRKSGAGRRRARLAGDVMVLLITGLGLGAVAAGAGVYEAILAVLVLAGFSAAGAGMARLNHVPVLRALVRWSHRLKLFYYYNDPGTPLELLIRPLTGPVLAPFRRRARAEVRIYLQIGAVFTLVFLLLDLLEAVVANGAGALAPRGLIRLWIREASVTFVVIYAFATPIGAVLTRNLLLQRTHRVPRILAAVVVAAVAMGLLP